MNENYLKVKEVADILKVSQMTVIRLCRDGRLPFIRVGTMRRIREIDLEYYMLNPNRKPKAPEPARPVYDGPPPELNGFEDNEDERQKELTEQCEKLKVIVEAKKASAVKAPEPPVRITNSPGTGLFPSGFDKLFSEE